MSATRCAISCAAAPSRQDAGVWGAPAWAAGADRNSHGGASCGRWPGRRAPPRAAARDAQWLRPELVIRAAFAGWTGDGLVRQAACKGLELEKDPHKVIRERPA